MTDSIHAKAAREIAIAYAWRFIGLPYRWGGDDPMAGFDCSGMVVEVLKAVGILVGSGFDASAHDLYTRFQYLVPASNGAGCVVFWFSGWKAIHVEMMVDPYHTIGASGGGSATTSPSAASASNAFVKIRPLGYRGANYKIVDPFQGV